MDLFIGETQSALDLELDGTIGEFSVSNKENNHKSIEVKYLLTHVSLDEFSSKDQRLLDQLSPVREVFNLDELDFDEIMQRDIDDARVSLELIPYLLEDKNAGLIKLFPPIVAVVLPLERLSRRPAKHYPRVETKSQPLPSQPDVQRDVMTCGESGLEVFSFEQLSKKNHRYKADGAKLRISTQNSALAIVDGQHRAMALLALYRNLKGAWGQAARQPYKHYYEVWPESVIKKFDTRSIQLPVMLCTFPSLDEDNLGDIDVVRAARRIFLTLNKNARKVSDSRNKLLDDQDLASECLRETLSIIKSANTRSPSPLRIYNVELDQRDRSVISNPLAITSVSHLYYICERVLFFSDRLSGLQKNSIRMGARKDASAAIERLQLKDVLSQQEQQETKRDNYSDKVAAAFKSSWCEIFAPLVNSLLGDLHPFKSHELAVLDQSTWLDRQAGSAALKSMLFDGQGTSRTFEDFESNLSQKMKDNPSEWEAPEIEATRNTIDTLNEQRKGVIKALKDKRSTNFYENLKSGDFKTLLKSNPLQPQLQKLADELVEKVFSTVAFQTALLMTFIDSTEGAIEAGCSASQADLFAEYVSQLNKFFTPVKDPDVTRMADIFMGKLTVLDGVVTIAPTNTGFKDIVHPGLEMQPDEWPRYRYLIVEIWRPTDKILAEKLSSEREVLRSQINELQYRKLEELRLKELNVNDLPDEEVLKVRESSAGRCDEWISRFLK
ncbi:Uncharacterized protein ALO68_04085 [Pseudomonas syringae pv. helianthi]|uniref:DGQHR domain-containing protein n=1 Tax=Pseudomonas syringae pv. helianthi TaxID=251654 RepID=A0A0P9RCH1_9PSED|nr:DNA sulfur modification protein DndB [Pseudomonas syringae group genomosp. 7]KPX43412.1 Uncharacterized protein ALO68_04085 [Pseudomonas syringae pv. helianthi]UNB63760.1 hypothetical protein MME54_02800 [Pseudomonas syringae pv. helianthi]